MPFPETALPNAPPRQQVPNRLSRASTRTHFLYIPRGDWANVTQGVKTEFRGSGRGVPPLSQLHPPTPIVIYSPPKGANPLFRVGLVVCEDAWSQPLGTLTDESLAAEGYESIDEFRDYWKRRSHTSRFDPLRPIVVFKLRPWRGEIDEIEMGRRLIQRLYIEPVEDGPSE